jgi:amino-acid N-acetyltransferase
MRQKPAMKIRKAESSDFPATAALLSESTLPVEGVEENFSDFIVAEAGGEIIGAIGLEIFGSNALLRSAVVAPRHRASGVGRQLVEALLTRAERLGLEHIYLLTTTAEQYFTRFGFRKTTRAEVPASVTHSAEFQGACPETATVLTRPSAVSSQFPRPERIHGENSSPQAS